MFTFDEVWKLFIEKAHPEFSSWDRENLTDEQQKYFQEFWVGVETVGFVLNMCNNKVVQ